MRENLSEATFDLFLIYQFIKRLVTPFNETDAFKAGIIDADGKLLKKPDTPKEKDAYGLYDRLVINLKRLLAKVPGGKSKGNHLDPEP